MVIKGILGKKIGMTQIFKDGKAVPVTVVSAGPCYIVQIKRKEDAGYNAVKIGYEELKKNSRKATKPLIGEFQKIGLKPMRYLQELRIENAEVLDNYHVGQEVTVDIFKVGEFVDVVGRSKGKGFQGVVKRHGFSGFDATHGYNGKRVPGSIGQCATPGRVWKNKKMLFVRKGSNLEIVFFCCCFVNNNV